MYKRQGQAVERLLKESDHSACEYHGENRPDADADQMMPEDKAKCCLLYTSKLERADYVIDNSGTKEELFRNVDAQIEALDKRLP